MPPADRPLTVVLPKDLADDVERRVASGEFASASDVVSAGLRALDAENADVEHWLRTEGVARFEAWRRGVGESSSIDDAFGRIERTLEDDGASS